MRTRTPRRAQRTPDATRANRRTRGTPRSTRPSKSTRYISGTSSTTFPPKGEGLTVNGSQLELRITAPSFALSQSYSYTFTTSGNQIELTRTCPSSAKETWYFDVQGSTLTIYGQPQSKSIWYDTFEKQP